MSLKLNLGCGAQKVVGYVNVDKYGDPDIRHDLEEFPWPWDDNDVEEIVLNHVLEHLGREPVVFFSVIREMYRVARDGALIHVAVPHFRHDCYHADPTHVRVITPFGLSLFSQRLNREWLKNGASNSPLGIYHNVDFELIETRYKPSSHWFRLHPEPTIDFNQLIFESEIYNNLIEELRMVLKVVKHTN